MSTRDRAYDPPSYAVLWREDSGSVCSGALELGEDRLVLDGLCRGGTSCTREVPYERVAAVHIGRAGRERLDGRTALVIELRPTRQLLVTSTVGLGMIHEIAERLSSQMTGVVTA